MSRDAFKHPYPVNSFWNMPIGSGATLVPLNLPVVATSQFKFRWEEDLLLLDPDAAEQNIMAHNAGWTGAIRCSSRTGGVLIGNGTVSDVSVPVPPGFTTDPGGGSTGYLGTTPNHSTACLRRRGGDIVLLETQPFHICTDGVPISQFVNSNWVGDSIYAGGFGVKGGAHGGSYLSAFGGTIRRHEWVPGGVIPHATKTCMNCWRVCYNHDTQAECFTWPASQADSNAVNEYGTNASASIPPQARMGMLLTLPNGYNYSALLTEPARILARSIYEYGTYLVDDNPNVDVFMFAVEWSNEGRLLNDFEANWGIKGFHRATDGTPPAMQVDFWADMDDIYTSLAVVTNNSEVNPGGPGTTRRAALAEPLSSITRYTFETGVDNVNVVNGGGITVSPSPAQYETAAAFAGSLLGVETTGVQWLQWAAPATNWSGSVYLRCTVNPGTGSTRVVCLNTASATIVAGLRFQATGAISIVDGGGLLVGTVFGSTWVAGDNFRFDWQVSNSGGAIIWQIRIFKGAAINSLTPTETQTRTITAAVPTLVQIGGQSAGTWNVQFDNVALSNLLEWIGPYGANIGPAPDAGPAQNVNAGVTVTLDGSGSLDVDGTIVNYAWTQIAGYPTVVLAGTGPTRTFTAPRHLGGTVLQFQLTVTDNDGAIGTDAVMITVNGAGTVTRYNFEAGPEGLVVPFGVGGVAATGSIPNTPTYRAAANFHTSLFGVRAGPVIDSNQAWLGFTTGTNSAGSMYFKTTAASTTQTNRLIAFQSPTLNIAGIRQNIDGTFCIDAAAVQQGASSTTTWAVGNQFRIDWDISYAALQATMRVRLFKNTAIDSDIPTEELIRTFAVVETADLVRIGARNIGWTIEYDDLSTADALGFIGPNVPAVVAYAGGDQSVVPWDTVTLNGTGSVGAITSYTWTQISGTPTVTLGGSGGIRTFEAPSILGGTTLGFRVSATDGVTTDTDDVTVNVASGDEFYLNAAGAWRPQRTDWL